MHENILDLDFGGMTLSVVLAHSIFLWVCKVRSSLFGLVQYDRDFADLMIP